MATAKKTPPASKGDDAVEVLAQHTQMIDPGTVKRYPKNPRVGNLQAIKDSIQANGFFDPILVQKSTMFVIDGNHRWQAAVELKMPQIPAIITDVDDDAAARIVLAANRTNDLATYDPDLLAEVLKSLDSPAGTGYSDDDYAALVDAIEYHERDTVEAVIRPALDIKPPSQDELGAVPTTAIRNPVAAPPTAGASLSDAESEPEEEPDDEFMDRVDAKLQGLLQLNDDAVFSSSNYYDIPDLAGGSALLDKLPTPLDTWAGHEATPDDGKTNWLWNYGVASRKNLPTDGRVILCFYTYDTYFECWWDEPAFYTTKAINAGINAVVVPDFSFYTGMPTAVQIMNVYKAQWLGRFFQEAGLKLIPRLQFSVGDGGKSMDFAMAGIPSNPPVLAQSIQNVNDREEYKQSVECTEKGLQTLQPKTWMIYGSSKRALDHVAAIDPVTRGMCDEVVQLDNYAKKRRGVVFDKKEGLAGQKKKEKGRRSKDKYADEEEDFDDLQKAEDTPKASKRREANRQRKEDEAAGFDPDDVD